MKKIIKISFPACIVTMLFVGIAAASDVEQKLDTASFLLETGKPDSAAVLLYDLVDTLAGNDSQVRALFYLAEASGQLGRFNEEYSYLKTACGLTPEAEFADKARFSYSRILLERGELDSCIAFTREFMELFNDSPLIPDVHYMTGIAYLRKGEYQRASNSFNEITKNHPDTSAGKEAVMKEGVCLYNLGLLAGSIQLFEKYLAETPAGRNTGEALYYLGYAYERVDRPGLSANAFLRLTMEFPSFPKILAAYYSLGKNLFESGRFIEAENAFLNYIANSVQADHNHDESLYYLERIKFKTGEYYSETQIAENFIIKYPDSPRSPVLLFDLARYHRMAGRRSKAVEHYRILLNNPLYSAYADSAAYLLADTYVTFGNKDRASSFLLDRARNNMNTTTAQSMFLKLGSLYEEWELHEAAIAWYDSSLAVDLSPEMSVQGLSGIGRSFIQVNRLVDAEKTYKRIIDEYPENDYLLDVNRALADLYFQQGRINESIHAAENALKYADNIQKTEILYYVAGLYEEVDEDHAFQLYTLIFNNTQNSMEQRSKALLKYADMADRKGDRIAAVNAYTKIINEVPDSISVNKARQKLSSINTDHTNPDE